MKTLAQAMLLIGLSLSFPLAATACPLDSGAEIPFTVEKGHLIVSARIKGNTPVEGFWQLELNNHSSTGACWRNTSYQPRMAPMVSSLAVTSTNQVLRAHVGSGRLAISKRPIC
jgi:hypothetical protein